MKLSALYLASLLPFLAAGCALDGTTLVSEEGQGGQSEVGSTEQPWNASFPNGSKHGHHGILEVALAELKSRGMLPPNVDQQKLYIHYGLAFADQVWLGAPGTPAVASSTAMDSHRDETVAQQTDYFLAGALKAGLKLTWRSDEDRPTTHLNVNLFIGPSVADNLLDKGESRNYAADNFFHYLNANPVELFNEDIDSLGIDRTLYRANTSKPRVSATSYGAMLYQLARKFWGNNPSSPSLNELAFAGPHPQAAWDTGKLVARNASVNMPSTYLGGLPFICSGGSNAKDPCYDGRPTWPAWAASSRTQVQPPKSATAALIYLGWALHMAQDVSNFPHASDWTGLGHSAWEDAADRLMGLGWPSFPLATVPAPATCDQYLYECPDAMDPVECTNRVKQGAAARGRCLDAIETIKADNNDRSALRPVLQPRFQQGLAQALGSATNRTDLCAAAGLTGSEIMSGRLNWQGVHPVFKAPVAAAQADGQSVDKYSEQVSLPMVALELERAVFSNMKLLACFEYTQDTDKDGVVDVKDNCPNNANPTQKDSDGNGVGDACQFAVVIPRIAL